MRVLYTEWRTQLGAGGNGDAKGAKLEVTEMWKEHRKAMFT